MINLMYEPNAEGVHLEDDNLSITVYDSVSEEHGNVIPMVVALVDGPIEPNKIYKTEGNLFPIYNELVENYKEGLDFVVDKV